MLLIRPHINNNTENDLYHLGSANDNTSCEMDIYQATHLDARDALEINTTQIHIDIVDNKIVLIDDGGRAHTCDKSFNICLDGKLLEVSYHSKPSKEEDISNESQVYAITDEQDLSYYGESNNAIVDNQQAHIDALPNHLCNTLSSANYAENYGLATPVLSNQIHNLSVDKPSNIGDINYLQNNEINSQINVDSLNNYWYDDHVVKSSLDQHNPPPIDYQSTSQNIPTNIKVSKPSIIQKTTKSIRKAIKSYIEY